MHRFYVTTAIPYVNGEPHLGFALELVYTDALARYQRLAGHDVRFLTGTDENALKNVHAAERQGVPVRELVDRNARRFIELTERLHVSNDDFIRTSVDQRHIIGAQTFWRACERRGDIYKRHYRGLYCVGCEAFYNEDELTDGVCSYHGTRPEPVEEVNYFFRLSRYRDELLKVLDSGLLTVAPAHRHREARAFIASGLHDFSISRTRERARGWGIEVPGDPTQVMYVWFDALTNYITALGYGSDDALYRRYWCDSSERVHVIGKDIVRFHAVYWPAMLISANEPLPTSILVHGFVTHAGRRMSKSLENVVEPGSLAGRWGSEAVRFWLLREVPFGADADFTEDAFQRVYASALADDFGNLVNRTAAMIKRYRGGAVPPRSNAARSDKLRTTAATAVAEFLKSIDQGRDVQGAIRAIWTLINAANRYVDDRQPWALARAQGSGDRESSTRLDEVLSDLHESLRITAESLRPILPTTSKRIAEQLGFPLSEHWLDALDWGEGPTDAVVTEPVPLFPRERAIP